MVARSIAWVDAWQREHALGGLPIAVLKKFSEDRASSLAALVAYYAFFALFTPGPRQIRALLPGVTLAAVGWLVLQALGGWYVDRVIADASATYGTFALVIGLLSWFWLGSLLVLLAAEVNVVLVWRLWPRSLAGEPEPADRRVLRRLAESTRRDRGEEISVAFSDDPSSPTVDQSPSTRPPAVQRPGRR